MRIFSLFCLLLISLPAFAAPSLYSSGELKAAGRLWQQTKQQWDAEQAWHNQKLTEIDRMNISDSLKEQRKAMEMDRHSARSHELAGKRDQVQAVLINEANARVKGGTTAVSEPVHDTAGTKYGEAGHRGMAGDRDAGAGTHTTEKIKEVLGEMGLTRAVPVKERAGVIELGNDFELTINKGGLAPKPGDAFHQTKVSVDARHPETYVSVSMNNNQAGRSYVEVQDHLKKAAFGLNANPKTLAASPKDVQKLAKGTLKTVETKLVSDEELSKILRQNGITSTPQKFHEQLEMIKTGKATVNDPVEALRMQRASQDIFNAAESRALTQAKQEIVVLREKAAALPTNDPTRRAIEENIVDSVVKIKETGAANDELLGRKSIHFSPVTDTGSIPKTGRSPAVDVDAFPKTKTVQQAMKDLADVPDNAVKSKAAKAFGAVMDIADIGNFSQKVEDYVEGKVTLGDVALNAVEQVPVVGGVVSTGRMINEKAGDYTAAEKSIAESNKQNLEAYMQQWEITLRKGGMNAADARRYVGNAMLTGSLDKLEEKVTDMRERGKDVTAPVLVVNEVQADDTVGQRAKDTVVGIATGVYEGGKYIISAPYRTVDALAQRELAEAEMEAKGVANEADSRTKLFRTLLKNGINSERALAAITAWDNGDITQVQTLRKEINAKKLAEEKALAEERAAQKTENQQRDKQIEVDGDLLEQYGALISYLETLPLTLQAEPNPVMLEDMEGNNPVRIRFTYTENELGRVQAATRQLEGVLKKLTTGVPPKVELQYAFSCAGQAGSRPGQWLTGSPAEPGVYPVTASLRIHVGSADHGLNAEILREDTINLEVRGQETISFLGTYKAKCEGSPQRTLGNVTKHAGSPLNFIFHFDKEEGKDRMVLINKDAKIIFNLVEGNPEKGGKTKWSYGPSDTNYTIFKMKYRTVSTYIIELDFHVDKNKLVASGYFITKEIDYENDVLARDWPIEKLRLTAKKVD